MDARRTAAFARLYHSTALLLPDASVLVAGGGSPGPQFNDNVEIYYPPYLYNGGGGLRRVQSWNQPRQTSTLARLSWSTWGPRNQRVALVKTGSVTHSFNLDQRFVELTFQQSGDRLTVHAPTRAADAPPGYYLMFVINVPAPLDRADCQDRVARHPNPEVTPDLDDPGNQTAQVGTAVTFQLSATDPNGDSLEFGATGLPPGLDRQSTGEISGIPTTSGTFNVVATASDGVNGDSESFLGHARNPPFA